MTKKKPTREQVSKSLMELAHTASLIVAACRVMARLKDREAAQEGADPLHYTLEKLWHDAEGHVADVIAHNDKVKALAEDKVNAIEEAVNLIGAGVLVVDRVVSTPEDDALCLLLHFCERGLRRPSEEVQDLAWAASRALDNTTAAQA